MVTAEIFTDLNLERSGPWIPLGLLVLLFQPPSISSPRTKMGGQEGVPHTVKLGSVVRAVIPSVWLA